MQQQVEKVDGSSDSSIRPPAIIIDINPSIDKDEFEAQISKSTISNSLNPISLPGSVLVSVDNGPIISNISSSKLADGIKDTYGPDLLSARVEGRVPGRRNHRFRRIGDFRNIEKLLDVCGGKRKLETKVKVPFLIYKKSRKEDKDGLDIVECASGCGFSTQVTRV
ncbi:hypothetical protein Q3G72_011730 [Acer saccharum]|nr:hypothetical protein Q3G72_011730 [Acer saccharum]